MWHGIVIKVFEIIHQRRSALTATYYVPGPGSILDFDSLAAAK